MRANSATPATLSGWFDFSKGRNGTSAEFFQSLPALRDDLFMRMVRAALEPVEGELRPIAQIRREGRKDLPSLDRLLTLLNSPKERSEKRLQQLLWHRGSFLANQKIVAFEVPCSLEGIARASVADFLVIDDRRHAPIIVEVKGGTASDSLSGVLLQLLVQWCFHKSALNAFRRQIQDYDESIAIEAIEPEAMIAAPARFYRETLRRSKDSRRNDEANHAFRLLAVLEAGFGLSVKFIEIGDDWFLVGTKLSCRPISALDLMRLNSSEDPRDLPV